MLSFIYVVLYFALLFRSVLNIMAAGIDFVWFQS